MSPRFRPDPLAGHHERARELAAAGLIEPLSPEEAAWLEAHLASCTACRAVADEYEGQRLSLRMLRLDEPLPPRDLWARTAAALDAEAGVRRPSRRGWFGGFHVLPMAPLAAALVVAVIVGGTLLSGLELGTGGKVPVPTPIAATAGEVRLVTVGEDGSLQISVGHYDGICPMGTEACANTASIEDRELGRQSPSSAVDALISPSGTSLVVVDRSSLLVYPVATPAVRPSASPEPATPSPAVTPEPATPSPSVAPSPTPSPSATASASASASPPASPSTSPDASVQPSASPSVEPSPSEPPSASPTLAPTPSPEVVVTPVPNGAIEIARDVIVVGTAADYSADGSLFAFAARPSDGTAGPDVYVWRTTERTAAAITTDHRSMFSSWLGDRLLVSRASADGDAYRPTTVIVDPSTGAEEPVAGSMFRPVVAPDGRSALWWDGTVEPTADGFGWQPRTGRLVLGAWSTDGATGDADLQVLADGASVRDWQVRWSKDGTVVALWVSDGKADRVGTLSAYRVDAATGRVDTTDRLLADTPALQGFSLQGEQLVWAIPSQDGPTTIDVLAWSGDQVGHVRLLPDGTVTIVR